MITGFTKSVFISYAPEDLSTALRLRDVLTGFVGSDEVWIRNIDLKSGELVAEAINSAVTEAKWFLFMLSEASANSDWGKSEINLATLRAIEDEDFRVVVLKLDGTLPPVHVQRAIQAYETIDLTTSTDKEYEFMKLAETIRRTISTYSKSIVYVDRGEDADQFALTGRRNKIVFIVGWSGIGKTAFVKHSIPNKLRKSPRTITLTRGHSTDLLCRQILQQLRV